MFSALFKKSWRDLSKRKSRTFFTALTIAIGVAALGMFAVNPMMETAMTVEIEKANLHDIQMYVPFMDFNSTARSSMASVSNVKEMEIRCVFMTRIYIGERRSEAMFVGVEDFRNQSVDKIELVHGRLPSGFEALSDEGNSRTGLFDASTVVVFDSDGDEVLVNITGRGRSISYPEAASGTAVFYAQASAVQLLANTTGFNSIHVKTEDPAVAERTVEDFRIVLLGIPGFSSFLTVPDVVKPGTYPGQETFDSFSQFFYVLTFLTLFCATFLIINTMNTMIMEQRREIAQLKAVGATRAQVVRVYLTTSAMMGGLGSLAGAAAGIPISYAFLRYVGQNFYGFDPSFSLHLPTVLISFVTGITLTILASIPALYIALQTTIIGGLGDSGIPAGFGSSLVDKPLSKVRGLPRTAQMGLRNAVRKKGRSAATVFQVSLAVGMFLGLMFFGYSLAQGVSGEYDNFTMDILVSAQTGGAKSLTEAHAPFLESVDGVSSVEPFILTSAASGDTVVFIFAFEANTTAFDHERARGAGRWYTPEEEDSEALVLVMCDTLAKKTGTSVGDTLSLTTPAGEMGFEVVGTSTSVMMNGMTVYMPLQTAQAMLGWNDSVNGFAVFCTSSDEALIDRTATAIEDSLLSQGYVVENQIWYVMEELNVQGNWQFVQLMIAVGALVVGISLIGLMSTLTMNVIDRTREIGLLRCLGSSSWKIRVMFGTEGVFLTLLGWLLGIGVGFVVATIINWQTSNIFGFDIEMMYPPLYIVVSFLVAMAMSLVVMQFPLRRAAKLKPGDALRYQ